MGAQVRAFHPYDGDVGFSQRAHRIFVGNLKISMFNGVCYAIQECKLLQIILFVLSWWLSLSTYGSTKVSY
jgi:hypothetical protein